MKRFKISIFDLVLLLLVILAGGLAYWQVHNTPEVEQPQTVEVMLGDIQRWNDRYTTEKSMAVHQNNMVKFRIKFHDVDADQMKAWLKKDERVYSGETGASLGKLDSAVYIYTDGVADAELVINLFCSIHKTYILGMASRAVMKVGDTVSLQLEDGTNIGSGEVIWIEHWEAK